MRHTQLAVLVMLILFAVVTASPGNANDVYVFARACITGLQMYAVPWFCDVDPKRCSGGIWLTITIARRSINKSDQLMKSSNRTAIRYQPYVADSSKLQSK
ncbi:hypothetical protein Q1695_001694 [Nippostrongylus brasiliensis]|nr:hypothetical protein Q1695_001694 [Nippostrongylus brasiliensis]